MRRKQTDPREEKLLNQFIDSIGVENEPTVRIFRLEENGKRTRMGVVTLDVCDEESIQAQFGGGTFLVRTVRSNGTFGPSKVIGIEERRRF